MQSLAADLEISRTTLYRWVGDRQNLISGMLSEMAIEAIGESAGAARGPGLERIVDLMRRFMETSAGFAPLRHLVHTEPELALRVMMAPGSRVSVTICRCLQDELERTRPAWTGTKAEDLADVITQIGMAYEWGNIAIEAEPDVDRALWAIRMLLSAAD